jgi:arylsulfatase A-like enzyme
MSTLLPKTRRVRVLLLLLLIAAVPGAITAAERPNVLLIVSDDQGWADIGYHNPELRTPHLDRLAREGVELDRHYVQPQCTPTRVALMTGRYPSRFGPHATQASNAHAFPFDTPTLATVLAGLGYDTALVGKWHMGDKPGEGPNQHGFAHSYGCLAGAVGVYDHRYRKGALAWHRNGDFLDAAQHQGHVTDLIAAEAVRWLREGRTKGKPFFLYLPFTAVHTPLVEEERWLAVNAHIADPDRRLFAAAATHMDWAVGEVLRALEETGQREKTLIIFTADNGGIHTGYDGGNYPPPDPALRAGFSSNAPLRGGKTNCFEGGIRVPAFAHWPGRLRPQKRTAPMHAVDWLPTLAALTGAQLPEGLALDGQNVWPLLAGERTEQAGPREFYWVWNSSRAWEALRLGDWKIVRDNRPKAERRGEWMLFNVTDDPEEKSDRAAEQPARVAELAARFEAHKAKDRLPAAAR